MATLLRADPDIFVADGALLGPAGPAQRNPPCCLLIPAATPPLPPLPQKERGKVQQVARQQAWWDREAWPRAAWYVRGLGW